MRFGFTLLTSVTGCCSQSSRTIRSATSKPPLTLTTVAPCTLAWTSLPDAIRPCGTTTTVRRPKRPPYAAADALVLPVDAQMIASLPAWMAAATATAMPRSLNEPVGFNPSSLKCSEARPRDGPIVSDSTHGVSPSPRLIRGASGASARRSPQRAMTPRARLFTRCRLRLDPVEGAENPIDRRESVQRLERPVVDGARRDPGEHDQLRAGHVHSGVDGETTVLERLEY